MRRGGKTNNRRGIIAATVVAGAGLLATSALTATNTVPDSQAGDGAGNITGYTVSAVSYDLNATNPQNVDQVSFTLDSTPAAGSEIEVRLDASSSTWYSCVNVAADVTCDTTGAAVVDADELRVVAVD